MPLLFRQGISHAIASAMIDPNATEGTYNSAPLRWRWIIIALFYAACAAIGTWPQCLNFTSELPSLSDPLQHLWVMRWYKTCLLEGRLPILCPDIQYPTGAPLGNFSPLHVQ